MKIGLLHNLYGSVSRGGAEKAVALMAGDLRKEGHEVFLITTRKKGASTDSVVDTDKPKIYYLDSLYQDLGTLPPAFRLFWHLGDIFSSKKYQAIKNILRAEKPDLVITHNLTGLDLKTPKAIRELGIEHHHFLHDIQLLHPSGLMFFGQEKMIDRPAAKFYQAVTRRYFASPAKIISPSHWLLDLHLRHGFFKTSTVEIRPLVANPTLNRPKKSGPAKNFLFVGQIEKHKGIFLLLKAFPKNSGLRLEIIGDGKDLAAAKNLSASDPRLTFRGRQDAAAIKEAMERNDYLIVPSLCYENSPTVIYEAHAAGLPVLAADLGGIPEIMGPEDKLFKPGDSDGLKNLVITLSGEKA